jgi:hypothetical protein
MLLAAPSFINFDVETFWWIFALKGANGLSPPLQSNTYWQHLSDMKCQSRAAFVSFNATAI